MQADNSSHQSTPQPRTDPLIVDPLPCERLLPIQAYVELHSGLWLALVDGGYQITFPEGTQQSLKSRDEHGEIYHISFPDKARLLWWKRGHISAVTGWPQGMSSRITLPAE